MKSLSAAAAILASTLALYACNAPPEKNIPAWKAGIHYEVLPDPTPAPPGKVRVLEFFWYGCGHCYVLEPQLVLWARHHADKVEVIRVPTQARPISLIHARLYYTLLALERPDLHAAAFDAIHRDGVPLETETQQLEFASKHGIPGDRFAAAANSALVKADLAVADRLMRTFRVDTVPTLVIGGRFKTGAFQAGGPRQLLEVATVLVETPISHGEAAPDEAIPAGIAPIRQ